MNVIVFQCPIGTWPTKRSPRGLQPFGRTILVLTAVSSINMRCAGSSNPCSRIQRRRARTTSSRLRSAAMRLFFYGDVMAGEETGERATTCRDAPLTQNPNHLIQSQIRLLRDQSEDSLRVLLQRRNAASARHWLRSSVVAKVLKPPDGRTNADVELLGRLSSRPARFHEINNPHSQRARIGSPHRSSPRRINVLRLADSAPLVNPPIHPGRDML
jgi:hypothetical protein